MKYKLFSLLHRYYFDTRASITLWAGLSILSIFIVSGMSVDLSYATLVKQKINNSTDSAALAVAVHDSHFTDDQERRSLINRYTLLNTLDIPLLSSGVLGNLSVAFVNNPGVSRNVQINANVSTLTQFVNVDSNTTQINVSTYSEVAVQQDHNDMDLLLSLDASGSMRGANIAGVAKAVASLMDDIFDNKNQSSSINIANVTFSADVRDVTPWTDNRNELEGYYASFLKDAYVGGGTNNGASLKKSHTMMQSRAASSDARKVVIALTDGKNTVGSDGEMLSACDDLKRDNVLVYTISFGSAAGSRAAGVMAQCASGPEYALEARGAGQLMKAFKKILAGMKTVKLVK